jgi:hypothetical protein
MSSHLPYSSHNPYTRQDHHADAVRIVKLMYLAWSEAVTKLLWTTIADVFDFLGYLFKLGEDLIVLLLLRDQPAQSRLRKNQFLRTSAW